MKVKLIASVLVLLVSGCAAYKPAPEPKGVPFPINQTVNNVKNSMNEVNNVQY